MDRARKQNIKRIVSLVCVVAVVALLAAMPLLAKQEAQTDGPQASILSGTAQTGGIQTELLGGGTLAEEDAAAISVPAAVKLTEYLVSNGDAVREGDAIAGVDRVTVMLAIAELQETLDYLAKKIEAESKKDTDGKVAALAGGIVKILYAEEGRSVQDVMLAHGALAVLSLDGLMAVNLTVDTDLTVGSGVSVTLSDGTVVSGEVETNLAGEVTVTLTDDAYAVGEAVQVTGEDGTAIGSGELYIYSPWNATAYAGTVDNIRVREGETVDAGENLMELADMGDSAAYRQLLAQRQEYEERMQELFRMYETEVITAPCDGIVSGVDEDSLQLLGAAQPSDTVTATPGSTGGFGMTPQEPEFELYDLEVTQVAAVTPQSTMTMDIAVDELDITALNVGMTAEIMIDALGGEKVTASITNIGNTGTNNGGSSKYTVTLTFDRGENMLAGMNGTATIVLRTSGDVLTIPAAALVEDGTKTIVYTGYDTENEVLTDPVTVTVGVSDGETVEILSGLDAGMTYYYAYYDTLEVSVTPDFGGRFPFGR